MRYCAAWLTTGAHKNFYQQQKAIANITLVSTVLIASFLQLSLLACRHWKIMWLSASSCEHGAMLPISASLLHFISWSYVTNSVLFSYTNTLCNQECCQITKQFSLVTVKCQKKDCHFLGILVDAVTSVRVLVPVCFAKGTLNCRLQFRR